VAHSMGKDLGSGSGGKGVRGEGAGQAHRVSVWYTLGGWDLRAAAAAAGIFVYVLAYAQR